MNERTARKIFEKAFGVLPEHPDAQTLINKKLKNNMYVLDRALRGDDAEQYTTLIAQLWEAIYVLGLRQRPTGGVS